MERQDKRSECVGNQRQANHSRQWLAPMNPFAFLFFLSFCICVYVRNQVLIYLFLLVSFTACVEHYGHLMNKITFLEKLTVLVLLLEILFYFHHKMQFIDIND